MDNSEPINYRLLSNNTNKWWFLDPCKYCADGADDLLNWLMPLGLRWNVLHCVGLTGAMFFNGCKVTSSKYGAYLIIPDDGSLFNGLQSISAWQEYFGHPSSTLLGLMNSAGFLPGCIASFFSDGMQHLFGKRITIWISCFIAVCVLLIHPTLKGNLLKLTSWSESLSFRSRLLSVCFALGVL